MLDGDEGLVQTLLLASSAVVGVRAAVFAAHGPVGAVTLDGVAGAPGSQLFHHTHLVEKTLFLADTWKGTRQGEKEHHSDVWLLFDVSDTYLFICHHMYRKERLFL